MIQCSVEVPLSLNLRSGTEHKSADCEKDHLRDSTVDKDENGGPPVKANKSYDLDQMDVREDLLVNGLDLAPGETSTVSIDDNTTTPFWWSVDPPSKSSQVFTAKEKY